MKLERTLTHPTLPAQTRRPIVPGHLVTCCSPAPDVFLSAEPRREPKQSRLELATYNVLYTTSDQQTKEDLTRLMKRNGVINLQEFDASHRNLFKWMSQKGWGHVSFPGGTQEPIIWDRSKYKKVAAGSHKLNEAVEHLAPNDRRYPAHHATWVRLEDRKTGKVFTTVSVHAIAHNRGAKVTPRVDQIARQQFRELAELTGRLKKHGPVIIAGDLNSNPHRERTWPGQILERAHLRSNWQQLGREGVKGGTHGNAIIDHLLTLTTMRDKLKLLSHRILRGMHSDHNAVEADYRLR